MKLFLSGLFGLLISCAVSTPAPAKSPTKAQISMLVGGKITVSAEGKVANFSLEDADKLPASVVKLLNQGIPKWRFEPPTHDGKPQALTSSMTMRVVARPLADKKYSLELGSVTFGQGDSSDVIRYQHHAPPKYPPAAVGAHVAGTVYLIVQINKHGVVENAAAQQVNLLVKGPPRTMKHYRELFADASLKAVRRWRFTVPSTGKLSRRDHWLVQIPVSYRLAPFGSKPKSEYGRWLAYMPGPKQSIPWLKQDDTANDSVDALPSDGIYLVGEKPKLVRKPHG